MFERTLSYLIMQHCLSTKKNKTKKTVYIRTFVHLKEQYKYLKERTV